MEAPSGNIPCHRKGRASLQRRHRSELIYYISNILYTFKRHDGGPKLEASATINLSTNKYTSDTFELKTQVRARFLWDVKRQREGRDNLARDYIPIPLLDRVNPRFPSLEKLTLRDCRTLTSNLMLT